MFGKRVAARKRVTYNRVGQPGVSHYHSIGNAAISLRWRDLKLRYGDSLARSQEMRNAPFRAVLFTVFRRQIRAARK